MNIAQIEESIKALICGLLDDQIDQDAFIYHLLLAYGHRKQSVTRLHSGERNMASKSNEPLHDKVIWKRHLYFKQIKGSSLYDEIDQMRKEKLVATNKIRFVIVTNFDQLLAVDTKTSDSLDINLDELPKQFDFFLPWAGMEKAVYQGENPADVKAAEKMAKLFDLIKGDNFDESNREDTEELHSVNVFLTRLLFCFFAEDTEIFSDNQFSLAIQSHTKKDGSDLSDYLNRLFAVLNTAYSERGELPDYLANFPYVNGGLFSDDIPSPVFSAKSRRMLIECGSELDWSDINPDIFGSMIQAVVHPDQRGGMGMHYTSVTNIMKVIEPLFLNDLYEELEKVESSATKLQKLQQRLGEIKIFDPACGSGNFLIIAYKEFRKLEMELLKRLQELELEKTGQISQTFSVIKLSQFYGIELDDFAHEVAILSLWLAEHQMDVEFKTEFGDCAPSLPLTRGGNVVCGNSARLIWQNVCSTDGEVYVLGNPPYLGSRRQSDEQKEDLKSTFGKSYKSLDYISLWFKKGSEYVKGNNVKLAFVSTNSICQGEQVALLWPSVLNDGIEIGFGYTGFKWQNSARSNAAVIVVIVSLQNETQSEKTLFSNEYARKVDNINPYLAAGKTHYIHSEQDSISLFPEMNFGNMPADGGKLLFTPEEKSSFIESDPRSKKWIKPLISAREYLNGKERYCLWLQDYSEDDYLEIPSIAKRVEELRVIRENSSRPKLAAIPHLFAQITQPTGADFILIPRHSSENRDYIPMGFFDKENVAHDSCLIVPHGSPSLFGVLTSRMHMVWVETVAGRIKTDYRYSKDMVYNTFPFPKIDKSENDEISRLALNILAARESDSSKTLAQLYDPNYMPSDLKKAHDHLDEYVDMVYRKKGFNSDSERLECLLSLHKDIKSGEL